MINILLKIFVFILYTIYHVHANQPPAGFATTCMITPSNDNTKYLVNKSAYGYLQGFINMKMNAQGKSDDTKCTDGLPQLDLCIYNEAKNPTCDFVTFKVGEKKSVASISKNPTLQNDASIGNISLNASMMNDTTLCLNMATPYGSTQLLCKNRVKSDVKQAPVNAPVCVSASKACMGINPSQSIANFSGQAVECVTDVLNNIFFDTTKCPGNPDSYLSSLNAFSIFQEALHNTVTLLLTLYIMMYGFHIVLNQDRFGLESVVTHVMKFLLVAYFAIGLGPFYFQDGKKTIHSGMIDWGLPLLREATTDFTQMVFTAAGPRNLCYFDPATYPEGKKAYALWDTIDCKVAAYFGIKSVYNLGSILGDQHFVEAGPAILPTGNITRLIDGPDHIDITADTPEIGLLPIILLMMCGGSLPVSLMLLVFVMICFSMVAGFISVYVVCFLTLHVLVYISPIFIPLALFDYTKKYFDAWLKATVGCALQPMIVGGFVALMMTMYDGILFGGANGCNFITHQYNYKGLGDIIDPTQIYRTFEMVLPSNISDCTNTIGYKILAYISGEGYHSLNLFLFSIPYVQDTLNASGEAMLLMVFSIIFYFFADMVYDFASELSGGVSVKGVSINVVEAVMNTTKQAVKAAISGAQRAGKAAASDGASELKKDDDKGKNSGVKDNTAPQQTTE